MIEVVEASALVPSTYNPRSADQGRLEWVALSLRKLGFLLPLYADENGEILSGHQRHYVATTMLGATKLPVFRVPSLPLEKRKALNIMFNRATNDISQDWSTKEATTQLLREDLEALARDLPDRAVDTPEFLRCLNTRTRNVSDLLQSNKEWDNYSRNVARSLYLSIGHRMPVIVVGNTIVNGVGRVQHASECGLLTVNVVEVSEEEAEFSRLMLNYLSMDFDLHNRYKDVLRYNSFRRRWSARNYLGRGFVVAMDPKARSKDIDLADNSARIRWKKYYGRHVVDFGSGKGEETEILRNAGVEVASFEPYKTEEKNEIVRSVSQDFCRKFLQDISDGRPFSSVFCSSVMNSVPYQKDREHMVAIMAALCSPNTRCYIFTKSITHNRFASASGKLCQNPTEATSLQFVLDYEPGILLGGMRELPKVQKFFSAQELYSLAKTSFDVAAVEMCGNEILCTATCPRVDPVRLREAIEFEFDLPYPDGGRMGLVDEAIEAFSKRLGIKL